MTKNLNATKQLFAIRNSLCLISITFISIFGFQSNALADCTVDSHDHADSASDCASFYAIAHVYNDVPCTSRGGSCIGIIDRSQSLPVSAFFSCDSCPSGYKRTTYTTQSSYAGCGTISLPTVYTCSSCGGGYYSNGGTTTSCTPCPSGTYGGGGNSSSCKTCPTYATCSGTGNATFKCNSNYYKNTATSCATCPTNATCTDGSTFKCNAGYYKNSAGTGCTQCPLADGIYTNSARTSAYQARYTSTAGATSITGCYLPSGTTYYDSKGTFTFDTKCNYE